MVIVIIVIKGEPIMLFNGKLDSRQDRFAWSLVFGGKFSLFLLKIIQRIYFFPGTFLKYFFSAMLLIFMGDGDRCVYTFCLFLWLTVIALTLVAPQKTLQVPKNEQRASIYFTVLSGQIHASTTESKELSLYICQSLHRAAWLVEHWGQKIPSADMAYIGRTIVVFCQSTSN